MKAVACWLLVLTSLGHSRLAAAGTDAAADPLGATPTLRHALLKDLQGQALAWLDEQKIDAAARAQAEGLWKTVASNPTGPELLDRLAATFALADPRARALVELCSQPRGVKLPEQAWLLSDGTPAFERHNLRLYYGRWLSQVQLYDEMLEQLTGLEPTDVVDPGSLLFYQGVAYHRLLKKQEGLKAIQRLLAEVADPPQRYRALASMMKVDLEALDDKTLDHIARRMEDIRRQLDMGRAGQKVVRVEDSVIESLDKLIKDMEDQQQQQQQQSRGGGNSGGANTPMKDSRIAPLKGPGETDHRRVGNTAGWGDLPPKEREEALQQIGKDFPAHYRDVIEQYFRKLAAEKEAGGK
jgi:hypothetical protein